MGIFNNSFFYQFCFNFIPFVWLLCCFSMDSNKLLCHLFWFGWCGTVEYVCSVCHKKIPQLLANEVPYLVVCINLIVDRDHCARWIIVYLFMYTLVYLWVFLFLHANFLNMHQRKSHRGKAFNKTCFIFSWNTAKIFNEVTPISSRLELLLKFYR